MRRQDLENLLLRKYPGLQKANLTHLRKEHLQQWLDRGKITLEAEILVQVFEERNQRAATNLKINRENFALRAKLKSFVGNLTDFSKSELIALWKKLFGRAGRQDDPILAEIGVTSNETVRETLDKAGQVVADARLIAQKMQKKYGKVK
ncbi:MAG: hypothetical protein Q6K99_09950 [Thermostichales cyanobacterium BF4_bins_65]